MTSRRAWGRNCLRREGSSDASELLTAYGVRSQVNRVTDDWGIVCSMQANAEGAVPERRRREFVRPDGGLGQVPVSTYRKYRLPRMGVARGMCFWCSDGMPRRSPGGGMEGKGCVGPPPGKQERRTRMQQAPGCRLHTELERRGACFFADAHDNFGGIGWGRGR